MMCKTHLKWFGETYAMRHPRGISRDEHKCNGCRAKELKHKLLQIYVNYDA